MNAGAGESIRNYLEKLLNVLQQVETAIFGIGLLWHFHYVTRHIQFIEFVIFKLSDSHLIFARQVVT